MGDVATFSKGTGYSKSDLIETGSPIILYGRLYTKYETKIQNVDTFVVPKAGSVVSKGGEVIVPGSGETAQDISIASVVEPAGILLGGDLNIIYPNTDLDPTFLAITISNGRPHFDMARRAQGKSIVHLHNADLKQILLKTPNLSEQKQICRIFESLDCTITLHEEKKRQLERLKSALLQKMFAEKQGYPVVRFKGFCDEWQGTKLGKVSKIVRGASPRPISDPKWFDNDSNVGWLRISDVTSQDGRIHHLEQHISKQGQAKTRVISEPHLLLSIAATVGKPLINYVKTGVHDGFLIFIEPHFDLEFMFQWLEMFRPQWSKYGQPGSQINLNSDLVKNQIIYLPSREEQNQIGIFFNQIDSLINLHQQKINNINSVKKSLLQKMFI